METEGRSPVKRRIYYGWVIVGLVALATFFQSAETLPVQSVFLKPLTEEFEWSRTTFTGALTIGTVMGGLISLGVGPFIDRFGSRWILVSGLFVLGGCVILLSTVNHLWEFYVLQIVGRMVTMGVVALAAGVVVPKWFVAMRGKAVAMSQMGLRGGNTFAPLYVQLLIGMWNWRIAMATMGGLILAISILPVALFMRRRPEDMGLRPDGAQAGVRRPEHREAQASQRVQEEVSFSLRQVTRLPSFYLLVTAFTIGYIMFPGLNLHLVAFLTDRGLPPGISVSVLALWSASGAVGSIIFGVLADRLGARRVVALNFAIVATGFLFLISVTTPHMALLWGIYQGFSQGGIFTLQQVLFANYYGRESLGAIRGVVWTVHMMANAAGPLAASIVYDVTQTYSNIFAIFVALAVLAGVFVFLARPPGRRHSAA